MEKTIITNSVVLDTYKRALEICRDHKLIEVPGNNNNYLKIKFFTDDNKLEDITLQVENRDKAIFKVSYGDIDAEVIYTFSDLQASLWNRTLQKKRELIAIERESRAGTHLKYLKQQLNFLSK